MDDNTHRAIDPARSLHEATGRALEFHLPYPPSANRMWRMVRVGRGMRMLLSREGRTYRARACAVLAGRVTHALAGRLRVVLTLHPPDRRKRDADNTMKAVGDALQDAGVIVDDAQIVDLRILKREPKPGGFVVVRVEEIVD